MYLVQLFTYDENVVELLYSIDLRQELVDHSVMHTCTAGTCTTLLTNSIQFIKDNDVQTTVSPQLQRNKENSIEI